MLFYRLELMTSTSLTTNTTKLQGSGYLDMMRYGYVGFFTHFCEIRLTMSNSKAILLLIHSRNLKEKMVRDLLIQSGLQIGLKSTCKKQEQFHSKSCFVTVHI